MSFHYRISNRLNEEKNNQTFLYHQTFADLVKCQEEGKAGTGHHVPLFRYQYGEKIWRCHGVRDVGTMTDDVVPTDIVESGLLLQSHQGPPMPVCLVGYVGGTPVFQVPTGDGNNDVGTMTDDVVPTDIVESGLLLQSHQGPPMPVYLVGYVGGTPVFKVSTVDGNNKPTI